MWDVVFVAAVVCRYDRSEEVIRIGSDGCLWIGEDGGFVGARDAVSRGSLASLRTAVQRADYYLGLGPEVGIMLYDAPQDLLLQDEEAFNPPAVELNVLADRCLVTCTQVAELGTRFDRFELAAQLSRVQLRRRLVVVDLSVHDETTTTIAHLTCEIRGRGRTLGDVADSADDLLALWSATLSGGLSTSTALDLLRARRPELLVGQTESSWLEAKREPHRLQEADQQLELAKDVAALGNTANGGILVIGLATTKRDNADVIAKVRPIPVGLIDPAGYRRVIDRFVYPPIEGLTIERIEIDHGAGLLVVAVPEQPPEVRPLLVLGAVVGKNVVGSHVSIVRRRGDSTTATHPAALHSLLAAGRAALAGQPPSCEPLEGS